MITVRTAALAALLVGLVGLSAGLLARTWLAPDPERIVVRDRNGQVEFLAGKYAWGEQDGRTNTLGTPGDLGIWAAHGDDYLSFFVRKKGGTFLQTGNNANSFDAFLRGSLFSATLAIDRQELCTLKVERKSSEFLVDFAKGGDPSFHARIGQDGIPLFLEFSLGEASVILQQVGQGVILKRLLRGELMETRQVLGD
jgi:hypothetical protein